MGSIQSIASLCVMVLLRHTSNKLQNLDYDKIPFQKVQFLSITFNGDVLFKLPLFFPTLHMPLQMQGMDRTYNGHVWNKVITTNIKKKIGLNFRKARCLGHLCCVQDECEHFVLCASRNEIFWCGECKHILVVGQLVVSPSTSSLGCKFCHVPPLCVVDYSG
jgi:hypothetical protein